MARNEKYILIILDILEFERDNISKDVMYFSSLHEQDLASILQCKKDISVALADRDAMKVQLVEEKTKSEESASMVSSLKDESRTLSKKLVELQENVLLKSGNVFAEASKEENSKYRDFVELTKEYNQVKKSLEESERARLQMESEVEKLTLQVQGSADGKSKDQVKVDKLKAKINVLEEQCQALKAENVRLRGKVDELLSREATETNDRFEQTLSLLESKLAQASSSEAGTKSMENILYQVLTYYWLNN